jgi:3-mercaptopyruvate sulfurtransferase SseA
VALLLRSKGVRRIRPLQGGLEAWREAGYPMTTIPNDTSMSKGLQFPN